MRFNVQRWVLMLPRAQACRWSVCVCQRRVLAIYEFVEWKDVGQVGETPRNGQFTAITINFCPHGAFLPTTISRCSVKNYGARSRVPEVRDLKSEYHAYVMVLNVTLTARFPVSGISREPC